MTASYPSLKDKKVYVTGGATGIGAAIVAAFAAQGARVSMVDRDAAASKALADRIHAAGHLAPGWRTGDITDQKHLDKVMDQAINAMDGFDILINNVANDQRHDPLEVTRDQWRDLMAVNLDVAFFAAQKAIGEMQKTGGVIVNLSSINALLAPPQMPAYVAAKSALLGLTKSLAREYGEDGIRVNAVTPGWVVTKRQLDSWLTPEAEEAWMQDCALKDRILPSDVANLVLFLASDEARMITGQSFVIDGGRT